MEAVLVSLDFVKAFDTIDHDLFCANFIKDVMMRLLISLCDTYSTELFPVRNI